MDRISIQQWATEQEAFDEEIRLIAKYGRKDMSTGCLRNRTDGGENPPKQTGHTPTLKQAEASRLQGEKNAKSGLLRRIGRENCSQGGKTVTPAKLAHLARVVESLRGIPRTPEVRKLISEKLKAAHQRRPDWPRGQHKISRQARSEWMKAAWKKKKESGIAWTNKPRD